MVTDYESAWIALGALIASKPQHGRNELLAAMAELAAEHRVPAGELSRLLRLHGVEVERARSLSVDHNRDGDGVFAGGLDSPTEASRPATTSLEGGHDGRHEHGHDREDDGHTGERRRSHAAAG